MTAEPALRAATPATAAGILAVRVAAIVAHGSAADTDSSEEVRQGSRSVGRDAAAGIAA